MYFFELFPLVNALIYLNVFLTNFLKCFCISFAIFESCNLHYEALIEIPKIYNKFEFFSFYIYFI